MSAISTARPAIPAPDEAIPDPGLALSDLYRFTVEPYERMGKLGILTEDDRVELIDGYLVTKRGKKPPHVWAVESVDLLLKALLVGFCIRRESPTAMPPADESEPNILVARGSRLSYLARHPGPGDVVLVVEVSDTTYHRDRGKKWKANARSGIPAYWIVNIPARRVEVYTDPTPEGYQTRRDHQAGESIPVVIDGQEVGRVAVDEILPPTPAAA